MSFLHMVDVILAPEVSYRWSMGGCLRRDRFTKKGRGKKPSILGFGMALGTKVEVEKGRKTSMATKALSNGSCESMSCGDDGSAFERWQWLVD